MNMIYFCSPFGLHVYICLVLNVIDTVYELTKIHRVIIAIPHILSLAPTTFRNLSCQFLKRHQLWMNQPFVIKVGSNKTKANKGRTRQVNNINRENLIQPKYTPMFRQIQRTNAQLLLLPQKQQVQSIACLLFNAAIFYPNFVDIFLHL